MVIKMDTNNMEPVAIWLQSLGLLFRACEPLTHDCLRTEDERKVLIKEIELNTYYCADVKEDMENGRRPKTWDEWNDMRKTYVVEEGSARLEPIDTRDFGNTLTKIFSGMGIHRK
jgi:hypothetical protein